MEAFRMILFILCESDLDYKSVLISLCYASKNLIFFTKTVIQWRNKITVILPRLEGISVACKVELMI